MTYRIISHRLLDLEMRFKGIYDGLRELTGCDIFVIFA